jgi:hypothetical protein
VLLAVARSPLPSFPVAIVVVPAVPLGHWRLTRSFTPQCQLHVPRRLALRLHQLSLCANCFDATNHFRAATRLFMASETRRVTFSTNPSPASTASRVSAGSPSLVM